MNCGIDMVKNPFIYKKCDDYNQVYPDIQVDLIEQYSQAGEDIVVGALLKAWERRTSIPLHTQRYLEIGANHPFATSSSYLLNCRYGMKGVLVEANKTLIPALKRHREKDVVIHAAVVDSAEESVSFYVSNQNELSSVKKRFVEEWREGAVGLCEVQQAPAMRINDILKMHFGMGPPIFIAIDIEGADLLVMKDLDWATWRPFVVQAEPSDHFENGTSEAMIEFMESTGYILVAQTPINLIFADSNQLSLLKTEGGKVSVASMVDQFQGYSESCSVGIVTRTKNRLVLLRRALESVKHQTYPHWKLVVVNDGGEKAGVDGLVGEVFLGDARVSVIHHETSKGMEAASNAGLSRLETDLAVIHDDDDSWAPEMLSVGTQVLRERNRHLPSVRGVVTNISAVYETVTGNHVRINRIEPWQAHRHDALEEGPLDLSKLMVRNQFPPIAFLFDLKVCRAVGLFDATLPVLGDWDFHLRFASRFDIWVHPETLAFYHHRPKAGGTLGNTVHAGHNLHVQYGRLLRNRWLRAGLAGSGPGSVVASVLRESSAKVEKIEDMLLDAARGHSPVNAFVKKKSKIAKYLSDLNRQRKEWQRGRAR